MNRYGRKGQDALATGLVIVILLALALACWAWVDHPLAAWLSRQDRSWYDRPWVRAYVQLGKAWMILWLVGFAIACSGVRPGSVAVVCALVVAGLFVGPLKPLVGRIRPGPAIALQQDSTRQLTASQRHSFPSGDAAAAFAAATALLGLVRRWKGVLLLTGASLVAGLRVLSLNHYPSDVLAGAALGVMGGVIGIRVAMVWYLPNPSHCSLKVRLAGALSAAAILAASILAEDHSSVVLFLKYYGPAVGLWFIWDLVEMRWLRGRG